jgi:hypothetical protein
MLHKILRAAGAPALAALLAAFAGAATLEKLSVEEMAQKATLIVRGKVTGCAGENRGSMIYTRCQMTVSERWKGEAGTQVDFVVPGGTARGLTQIFTGTPKFATGEEHVLFLWAGRSKINQVIGLSQGKFDIKVDGKGSPVVQRAATSEVMLDKSGLPVTDTRMEFGVSELRNRVRQALAAEVAK